MTSTISVKSSLNRIYLYFVCMAFCFYGCGTGVKIAKEEKQILTSKFIGTFENISFKRFYNNKSNDQNQLLLKLFKIPDSTAKEVSFRFPDEETLLLSYENSKDQNEQSFLGKFSKRGYFQIFFSRERIEIPPFIPLIFSSVDIDRIRIGITKKGDLVIDKYWEYGGSILFLGAGGSYRSQYFFEKVDE